MQILKQMAAWLGGESAELILEHAEIITEIRLRINRPVQLSCLDGSRYWCETIDAQKMIYIINRLMNNSMYACEHELRRGYFTAAGGCRIGVCGRVSEKDGSIENMSSIASACIRIPREIQGCADRLFAEIYHDEPASFLIIAPPGKGKTTLLREMIRLFSNKGCNIAVADERSEIAACLQAVPELDVGRCTDVMDGCSKSRSLAMMIRACSPDMVAADEIGSREDAEAIMDAARCGVKVAATVHGSDFGEACSRIHIKTLLQAGIFDYCIILGSHPGDIDKLLQWKDGVYKNVEGFAAVHNTALLHRNRPELVQ